MRSFFIVFFLVGVGFFGLADNPIQAACRNDVMSLCKEAVAKGEKPIQCLMAKKDSIKSEECKKKLKEMQGRMGGQHDQMSGRQEQLRQVCGEFIQKHCGQEEKKIDCLLKPEFKESLPPKCKILISEIKK